MDIVLKFSIFFFLFFFFHTAKFSIIGFTLRTVPPPPLPQDEDE